MFHNFSSLSFSVFHFIECHAIQLLLHRTPKLQILVVKPLRNYVQPNRQSNPKKKFIASGSMVFCSFLKVHCCVFFFIKKKKTRSHFCALIKMSHAKISDISCRGEFEMQRREKLPNSCYGMQAHLSTNASPKVLEVVVKLPQKIILEEVPRLSAWPT